jgi:glutathione synthase/RimK-type ligase-like ATP-grasp enzyme
MYGPEYEKIIFEICDCLGIVCRRFEPNCLALTWNDQTQYIWSRRFPQNSATSSRIIDSKCMCSSILADCGGVVIKPNDSYEGKGVYLCFSQKEIECALYKSFQSHSIVAAAPYINAHAEYRIVYLDGECLLLYKKKLPEVIGDGHLSLKALAEHLGVNEPDFCQKDQLNIVPARGEHITVGWKFNLSCGSTPEVIDRFSAPQLLLDIATKAAETVNAKFVSIDLLEESGSHDLMVLELNAGVAMDQFIIKNPDGRKIAYSIYEKSIKNMFHCN